MTSFSSYIKDTISTLEQLEDDELDRLRDGLRSVHERGGILWVAGNGGSASTASHFVADLSKTLKGFTGKSVRTIALHEMVSLQTAYSNDVNFESGFSSTLKDYAKSGDGLLILSVSGTSPNLVRAKDQADEVGIETFAIVGAKGQHLANNCHAGVVVRSEDFQVVENIHVAIMHWFARTA